MKTVLTWAAALAVLASWRIASGAVDQAALYLKKVRQGERTYLQDGGWGRWRNRLDLFYEADYILGAGTPDPRLVAPSSEGDPLGSFSVGGLVLLSRARSPYDLTFFALASRTFQVNTDDEFALLPILAPFAPAAFAREGTGTLTQSTIGAQLRWARWIEAGYGLLLDQRRGVQVYRSFYELNLPFAFLKSNIVPASEGGVERVHAFLHYDEATWLGSADLGMIKTHLNEDRTYYYASFDGLGNWFSAEARLTSKLEFASARLGIHTQTHAPGTLERNGKFGVAWDLKLLASLSDPSKTNDWSATYAGTSLHPGVKAEFSVQAPMMTYLGVFVLLLTAQAAALEEDERKQKKLLRDGAKAAKSVMDAADEDDALYGALTLGVAYNDSETLREVPGAIDHVHAYFRFRFLY